MSERRQIEVQGFTEIRQGAKNKYFTLSDMAQQTYVCSILALREYCHIGQSIDAEIEPPKQEGRDPWLVNIYVNGKPVYKAEAKTAGRAFGKSKEELAQIKELAEIQNHSIQSQTALNRATDIYIAQLNTTDYKWNIEKLKDTTREFYQLLQSLTSQKEVIYREKKQSDTEAQPDKKAEVSKEISANETGQEDVAKPIVIKTAKDLMDWAKKHNKYPSWVRQQASIGANDIITNEMAVQIHTDLKALTGWED